MARVALRPQSPLMPTSRRTSATKTTEQPFATRRKVRIVCVGAGASGLQMAYKMERKLKDVEFQIYEKNKDVGGTWLENRYPGCECDIPSHSYQFAWERNPDWSRFYSSSEEIWRYFKSIAVKYDLEKYVKFEHKVRSAQWNENQGKWDLVITKPDGTEMHDQCEILANCSGLLNSWKWPDVPGILDYKGTLLHSAAWDATQEFAGKTIAVIGGGSSAVQIIPVLQKSAKKLIPFLRSPVWITTGYAAKMAGPNGTNFSYSEEQKKEFRTSPKKFDEYCRTVEGELNKRFSLVQLEHEDQKKSKEVVANMMRQRLGNDPELCQKLVPSYALGCRRLTPGVSYLESLTEDNVDAQFKGVARFTPKGVVDDDGVEHEVDVVVCATGFNTNFAPHFSVIGQNNRNLQQEWDIMPQGYLSVMANGYPNMYFFVGPNGPVSHSSTLPTFGWNTRYMFKMIDKMQKEGIKAYNPKAEAQRDFFNHTHEMMKRTAWSSACRSWFKNGKVHGPTVAVWAGSRLQYFEALKDVRFEDFDISYISDNRFQYFGNGYTETELDPEGNSTWYFDDPDL
ncbi:FAD/NAD(P)-binding domain-containing protein [Aspergillus campestris IBT 28561]|uniref:FAD/NAD(P)-binding domain-containing protein n=1 Tax=Aspergillus campestris (strain IBT 28561) TaxID=1392248 RepID=A0A2I1DAP9_ASPC2|nr:FAD/NAD(P)-binding domain-containing protein [Aspergillus campestris IBT 28561]PKY06945.1 FAD/NAD(P)-binding domain-containing protein [Aspergillus campestris IBT 28561]